MACNFILGDSGTIRTTQFNASTQYNIEDINFYIPLRKADDNQVFLVLKNERNLYEIVELTRSKGASSGTNILYRLPLNQALRVNNEQVSLNLMLIDRKTGEFLNSSCVKVKISTDNFQLARQVFVAQSINQKIQDLYVKIIGLTEENRQLYEKMREGEKFNESNI